MVSQALYASNSPTDGRRNYRTYHDPYHYSVDRRYSGSHPQSPHNSRVLNMTDHQGESDSSNQRKRISVACGRCRKRKIRCSGDPGGGLPCTNCKSAGTEPCQFLRVASQERHLRNDPSGAADYPYNVQDGRGMRGSVVHHPVPYGHDLPHVGSSEMLAGNSYRGGGSAYYGKIPSYYSPVTTGYALAYADEYADYSPIAHSSQHVLGGHDMAQYPTWPGREYGYGGTSTLVHRPAPSMATTPDSASANFSFHSMAAHLPVTSVSVADRLLPAPSSRSMPYTTSTLHPYRALPPAGVSDPSPVHAAAVLTDMASGTYVNGFDPLSYSSSGGVALQAHAGSEHHSSRTNSEAYSPDTESIFAEHEQSLRSHGSAVDLNAYTYSTSGTESGPSSLRRGSAASGCPTSTSSSSGNGMESGSRSSGHGGQGTKASSISSSQGGGSCDDDGGSNSNNMVHSHHSQQQHMYAIQDSHHANQIHGLPLVTATGGGPAVSGGTGSTAGAYLAGSDGPSGGSSSSGAGCNRTDNRRPTVGSRG